MEKLSRITLIGFLIIIALISVILVRMPIAPGDVSLSLGSVGGEYNYQYFTGSVASTTLLKTGQTTLGSVVITEDAAEAVTFLDATSTTAYSIANADTISVLQASLVEGVYMFDILAVKGLAVSTNGFTFAGNMTVTYK